MMPLHSPSEAPERVLLFGQPGAGKTHAWLTIAKMLSISRSDATLYVIDTDNAVARHLATEFPKVRNVEAAAIFTMDDVRTTTETYLDKAQPGDWIIVDRVDELWVEARNDWIRKAYGMSTEDYYLMVRTAMLEEERAAQQEKRKPRGTGFEFGGARGMDWDMITRVYLDWEKSVSVRAQCHVLFTASLQDLSRNTDINLEKLYGGYKVRAAGQKQLGHRMHTILWLTAIRDRWTLTTVRDRGRELQKGLDLEKGFARAYLMGVAGWKL